MSDAEFEFELVEALNMLLEDERASVEMEVALASGATEYGEREALATMGAEDIHFCEQLRGEMEQAGLAVTPQINGIVFQVIGAERYDDRLRAFAHHQRVVAERARELQESNLEGALRTALVGISQSHDVHAQWIEQRASEFAETRTMEFGQAQRGGAVVRDDEASAEASTPSASTLSEPAAQNGDGDPETLEAPASAVTSVVEPAQEPAADEERSMEYASEEPAIEISQEPDVAPDAEPAQVSPKPRARATRAASAAKPASPRAKAAPKSKPATTAPRRTRRPSAPADE